MDHGVRRCAVAAPNGARDGIGRIICDGLGQAGCEVRLLTRDEYFDLDGCQFLVTYGPMRPLTWLLKMATEFRHPIPIVVWFTEQLPWPRLPRGLTKMAANARYGLGVRTSRETEVSTSRENRLAPALQGWAGRLRALGEMLALKDRGLLHLIAVLTETNRMGLARHGLPAVQIPLGHHPQFGSDLGLKRDIDVVFLGSLRDRRRRRIIAALFKAFARKGIRTVIRDGSEEHGYVFGEERTQLLNRAKILLNVMRKPWDDPLVRMLLAAPNGAMLISEEVLSSSTGPFRKGEHFVEADVEALPDTIDFYLNNEVLRAQIAERARAEVTQKLTMKAMAGRLLYVANSVSAHPLPASGQPGHSQV